MPRRQRVLRITLGRGGVRTNVPCERPKRSEATLDAYEGNTMHRFAIREA
jgi:hypothetical protein